MVSFNCQKFGQKNGPSHFQFNFPCQIQERHEYRHVGVVCYDRLERKKRGAKANDTEKESVHIKKQLWLVNLHILGSLCTLEEKGGYQLWIK